MFSSEAEQVENPPLEPRGGAVVKNFILYVVEDSARDETRGIERHLRVQVENSLALGWGPEDLVLYANFPFEYLGVRTTEVSPPRRPRKARATSFFKTYCILDLLDRMPDDETIWYHDVDAFQLRAFQEPSSRKLAFCLYSARKRLLVQGGSLFFNRTTRPIFEYVFERLHNGCRKDEYALTDVTALAEFDGSFEILDYSYNLGSTDFELRYQVAAKPIKVVHFHPERAEHRSLFVDCDNALGVDLLDARFRALLEKHISSPTSGGEGEGEARGTWSILREWLRTPLATGGKALR